MNYLIFISLYILHLLFNCTSPSSRLMSNVLKYYCGGVLTFVTLFYFATVLLSFFESYLLNFYKLQVRLLFTVC